MSRKSMVWQLILRGSRSGCLRGYPATDKLCSMIGKVAATWMAGLYLAPPISGQTIQYVENRKVWLLTTKQNSYAMGVGPDGTLRNIYWGAPLWRVEDLPALQERRDISSFDPKQML